MTTSDKKPRRTTKSASSAKTAKSADTPGPDLHDKAPPVGASKAGENRRIKDVSITVTPRHREDRNASIALAAYFRAEARGFAPGHEVEDWLAAEEEVDQRLLGEGRVS